MVTTRLSCLEWLHGVLLGHLRYDNPVIVIEASFPMLAIVLHNVLRTHGYGLLDNVRFPWHFAAARLWRCLRVGDGGIVAILPSFGQRRSVSGDRTRTTKWRVRRTNSRRRTERACRRRPSGLAEEREPHEFELENTLGTIHRENNATANAVFILPQRDSHSPTDKPMGCRASAMNNARNTGDLKSGAETPRRKNTL